ncbi:MAG TPA: tetratricopeptide repeat protein [Anaeromyxobacteraceae bacterium]|nr:tetratricopeptide repeat protein [Anaeromyxobacteraceae bacterium]
MAYQPEIEKLQRQYQDDPARVFAQLADVYRRSGRVDEAVAMLREHLAARPNYVSGLIVLGRCLVDQKKDAEARETFEQVIAIDREHIIALRALGEIGERTGDVLGARQWYQRLLDVDPMNEEAEAALARLASMPAAPPAPAAAPAPAAPPPAEPVVPRAAAAPARPPGPPAAPAPPPTAPKMAPPVPGPKPSAEPPRPQFAAPEPPPEPDEALVLEREPDEPEPALDPSRWAAGPPGGEDRIFVLEDGADAPSGGGPPPDMEDVRGWIEHPEELLKFEEGAGAPERPVAEEFEPFDESLGWGAGERVSRQISDSDIEAAEAARAEDLSAAVQGLPGLENTAPPAGEEVAQMRAEGTVEGLQQVEYGEQAESLEGLETDDGMMPPAAFTPPPGAPASEEAFPPAPPEEPVPAEPASPRGSLAGLPVIFPGEAPEEPLRVEPRPEPVVTETMAELYASQGLVGEARETYRQLLAARPHDRRLAARLAELQEPAASRAARAAYSATATGGQAARAFLGDILVGRSTAAVEPPPAPPVEDAADAAGATEATEAAPEPTPEPEPMERAFGEEAVEPRGEPTHPAPDEISLAAVFGEQPPPAPPTPPPAREAPTRPPGGFSFDEFFSARRPAAPEAPPARAARDALADDEGEEAFRDWLKGLKS